jgi:prepilin-type N-terminal cleavage/methylation domain-containing protein
MKQRSKGFTLIELVIVLGIIALSFSYIVINSNNNVGLSLKSAQRTLTAIAQGVKSQAVKNQTPARIIIYADKGENRDDDKYLRFFGIVTRDPNNPKKWMAGTKGTYLPKGIYFMPELSRIANGKDKRARKMYLEYPRIKPQANNPNNGEEYYYYEYNANGTTAPKFVNAWLVFGAGSLKPSEDLQLDVSFDNPSHKGIKSALIFRKVGSTTLVTDSDQINRIVEGDIQK